MKSASLLHNLTYVSELTIIFLTLIISGYYFQRKYLLVIGIGMMVFVLFFFRNNYWTADNINSRQFISPSSSKIVKIAKYNNHNSIYTYLSPLDRHFMIAPVDCEIIKIQHRPVAETDAERLRVTFRDNNNKVFSLDQIVSKLGHVGWMLRFIYPNRCVIFNKVGDKLKQGQRYGLIRFGSNMQYNLPKSYKILVKPGEKPGLGIPIAITD